MWFRNFVVVDNDSNDNTPNILEKFRSKYSDALVLILHDPVVGYYQKEKTNAAANYGRSIAALVGRAIDWILPLDGDEFLCPGHELDFAQLFCEATQAGYQIIAFNWSNVATSDINSPISSDDNLFLRFDLRHTRPPMNIFKIAAHVGINPVFDNGNHYTLDSYQYLKTTLSASKYGASMMHMHMRNAAHVLCKIIKGGKAFEAAPELKFGCHWKDWYSRYKMYGDVVAMEFLNNYLKQFSRPD